MSRLISKTPVYEGWSKLYKATIELDSGAVITREVEDHGFAIAVLPYDPERRVALLVRQMRNGPILAGAAAPHILEVPAGIIDPGESEETAVRREALEEAGVTLNALDGIGPAWSMPGVSTEWIGLYLGAYTLADRVAAGGGLEEENEEIEVLELSLTELARLQDAGALNDMKTLVLLSALRLRRPELFA